MTVVFVPFHSMFCSFPQNSISSLDPYTYDNNYITAQTAFHHCTFQVITAHFVHHCMLKQALRASIILAKSLHNYHQRAQLCSYYSSCLVALIGVKC